MNKKHLVITGAASGVGRGLAIALAGPMTSLYLADIDSQGLRETVARCERRGGTVSATVFDVTQRDEARAWITSAEIPQIDDLFACAGLAGSAPPLDAEGATFEDTAQVQEMLATNLDGVLNVVLPALERIRTQPYDAHGRRGRICVIASIAAFLAFPGTPSYCASKAAIDRFIIASAAYAQRAGIQLTSVCSSFIATPMIAHNRFPMLGLVSVHTAVNRIIRGVRAGKRRIVFPAWLVWGARISDLFPVRFMERLYLTQPAGGPGSIPFRTQRPSPSPKA